MHSQKIMESEKDASTKLVALFVRKIVRHEIPQWDPLATHTLGFLVEALSVLETTPQTWGAVAKYVLHKAENKSCFHFYAETLCNIAYHAASEVAEEIVETLVKHGEATAVLKITANKLERFVTREEIEQMLEFNYENRTSSKNDDWKTLLALADSDEGMSLAVEKCLRDIQTTEGDIDT